MGVASANAKLLLLGEHSAVYGHPAVGLSLPWPLRVTHTPSATWQFPDLGPHEAAVRSLVLWLVERAAQDSLPAPTPGRLEFTTAIPLASGFGSSGALCAALVNLFFAQRPLSDRDRLAWQAEALFHGTPSGIDTALALRQGWWSLDASTRPVTASPLPDPGLALVAGSLVRSGDTKTLVGALATRRASGDTSVVRSLDTLGALATRALVRWGSGADELAGVMNQAREVLRGLGLETAAMSQVLDAALACPGALAGKLSGAGGGGAFVVLFRDRTAAQSALPVLGAAAPDAMWTARPQLI